jgi:hypothetical protein
MPVVLKSPREIEKMRRSGQVVRQVLEAGAAAVKPGASTMDLERISGADTMRELGATPAFKGYHGYPCVLCTSVNHEVVHGIPSDKRVLKTGDIVSIDTGVVLDGYYGDSAITVPVGSGVDAKAQRLLRRDAEVAGKGNCGSAGGRAAWATSARRCRKWSRRKGSAWCGSLWATALARACMRSRRCRTTASAARDEVEGRAWCSRLSPW